MDYFNIIVLIVLSGILSGIEIAFIASDKLRFEIDKKKNKFFAKILNPLFQNPKNFIATILIANNTTLVIYGIVANNLLEPSINSFTNNSFLALTLITIISSLIILLFGEFLPKSIFMIKANALLYAFAVPSVIMYYFFYPLTWLFISFTNYIIKIFNRQNNIKSGELVFSKFDLFQMIEDNLQNLDETKQNHDYEFKIFHNALTFDQVKLKECIIPRTEIAAIEINSSIELAKEKFIETGYSKLLIYKENIDNIVGYIHIGDMFNNPKDILQITREIIIVPETLPANKLLSEFIQNKKSIALVVDEFGGTSGIVTIEDVLEEIFGEINDEHDTDEFVEKKITENEYMLSGRLEIDAINEKFNLNIPESQEYETLAGFILYHHNSIPKPNETITIKPYTIKILKSTSTKIELVILKIENEDFNKSKIGK